MSASWATIRIYLRCPDWQSLAMVLATQNKRKKTKKTQYKQIDK